MRGCYAKMLGGFDDRLKARGYTDEQVKSAKSLLGMFGNRTLDDHVTNVGTVSALLDERDECAKVLRLYLLGALDYFDEGER